MIIFNKLNRPKKVTSLFKLWPFIIINLVFVSLILTYCANFFHYRSKFFSSQTEIIEGLISDYHPLGFGGKGYEIVKVGGRAFYYEEASLAHIGYKSTKGLGGQLEKGKYVRIIFVENHILKLEMED
jgi:hypothetical protein